VTRVKSAQNHSAKSLTESEVGSLAILRRLAVAWNPMKSFTVSPGGAVSGEVGNAALSAVCDVIFFFSCEVNEQAVLYHTRK
jgi:hypothetical protein